MSEVKMSNNVVNVTGTLLDVSFKTGKNKKGKDYECGTMTLRVTQQFGGNEEISEIPVSFYAAKYKNDGTISSLYNGIQDLKTFKSVQVYGAADADTVSFNSGNLQEFFYASHNTHQVHSGWQIRSPFFNKRSNGNKQVATFSTDIYILNMREEVNAEGEETGRLIIKGGVVQWGEKLDVIEYYVEDKDCVSYISRHWEVGDTVNVRGFIRFTTKEVEEISNTGWGEDIPSTSTRAVRELIITKGSDEPFDEDKAYDKADMRRLSNERKARLEETQNQQDSSF